MLSAFTTKGKKSTEGRRNLLEVMGKFMALILMTVSWVYIYHQTHQVSYTFTIYSFLYISYTSTKQFFKRTKAGAFSSVKLLG